MSQKHEISITTARRMALNAQLLDGRTKLPRGKDGTLAAIEKLGYVQIDTISVIERAHHHTIRTRRPDYRPEYLHELQAVDRSVFEYFTHALSYVPMSDFRFYLPRMHGFNDPYDKWQKDRLATYRKVMKPVLERVRAEGPLGSSAFIPERRKAKGEMWHRDPYRSALELLHLTGEIMVCDRKNFERIYDLTERVLPADTDTRIPEPDELGAYHVRRALRVYGIATEADIRSHLCMATNGVVKQAIGALVDQGEVTPVTVKGDDRTIWYALGQSLENTARLRKISPRLHLLSPFDNLIIRRDRLARLFDFDYVLECYVTPAKRKHGFFVLPILWGEEFVGRLDPKADRKAGTLLVQNLMIEKIPEDRPRFLHALADKLLTLARVNGCDGVSIVRCSPAGFGKQLQKLLG